MERVGILVFKKVIKFIAKALSSLRNQPTFVQHYVRIFLLDSDNFKLV